MAAYIPDKNPRVRPVLSYLPLRVDVPGREGPLVLDYVRASSPMELLDELRDLLNYEIENGGSYPYPGPLSESEFMAYFLSHDAFVLLDGPRSASAASGQRLLGSFYVKPNYPGISSHICNGGFLVPVSERGHGFGRILARLFPRIARDLGYRASVFNLVYTSNVASVRLWLSTPGYKVIGRVPGAGRINGDYVDAIQVYNDLKTIIPI